jgi:hypothetical protein
MRRRNPPTYDAAAQLELFERNFGAKLLPSAPLKNSQAVIPPSAQLHLLYISAQSWQKPFTHNTQRILQ